MDASQVSFREVAPSSVEVVTQDYAIGVWRNVLVVDWKVQTTGDGARDVELRLRRLARTYARGVFYLAFVTEQAQPPDFEARYVLAQMLKSGGDHTIAGAVVFDGGGLRGAFVRGVATGLVMLARPSFPFVVCSLKESANLFADMATARGLPFAAERYVAEVTTLRAEMAADPHSEIRRRSPT